MPESVVGMGDRSGAGTSKSLVDARETFQTLHEISRLLNTGDTTDDDGADGDIDDDDDLGLDMETLAICVRLCEQGANPEALAIIIRELRRESEAIRQQNGE